MKNKYLVIFLTCFVFVAVSFVGLKVLFTVRDISVSYSVVNESNAEEVSSILDKYKGKLIFSVDEKKIVEEITENRYLKVTEVKKIFPCEISVSLCERTDLFYYETKESGTSEYYCFDEEFFVVEKTLAEPKNRGLIRVSFADKLRAEKPSFELKKTVAFSYGFNGLLTECYNALGDRKSNITSIIFVATPDEENYRIALKTVEGVAVEIMHADAGLTKKVVSALDFYEKLSESDRIANYIHVAESDGVIECTYTRSSAMPEDWGIY